MFFNKGTVTIVLSILCGLSYVNYTNWQKTNRDVQIMVNNTKQTNEVVTTVGQLVVAYFTEKQENYELQKVKSENLFCMTQNLYFEGGNQTYQGLLAIGQVVKKRESMTKYPDTVCGVVKQKKWRSGRWVGQFSWYTDGKPDGIPTNALEIIAWNKAHQIAKTYMESEYNVDHELISATLYHAYYVKPNWDMSKVRFIKQVDDHLFYEEI